MTELERASGRGGVVVEFDESAGLGIVHGHDGRNYAFHCIEIADGTRTIERGVEVTFHVIAKLGRWEAAAICS